MGGETTQRSFWNFSPRFIGGKWYQIYSNLTSFLSLNGSVGWFNHPRKMWLKNFKCFGLLVVSLDVKVDSYLPFVVCMVYVFCWFATYVYIYIYIYSYIYKFIDSKSCLRSVWWVPFAGDIVALIYPYVRIFTINIIVTGIITSIESIMSSSSSSSSSSSFPSSSSSSSSTTTVPWMEAFLQRMKPSLLWGHQGFHSAGWQFERGNRCWWLKCCTSWWIVYPIIYKVLYLPGGAEFLPSTVGLYDIWFFFPRDP